MRLLFRIQIPASRINQRDLGMQILNFCIVSLGDQDSAFAAITGIYKSLTLLVSATSSAGASATFTFAGDVVQIFGTSGPNDAPYSAQLDGGSSINIQCHKTRGS